MKCVVARACANVALAKYWGKRDEALNLPYKGSLSITLDGLTTTARVSTHQYLKADSVRMNGLPAEPREAIRITAFLNDVRKLATTHSALEIELETNFPVAAGIASSASTFAALAVGASTALGLSLLPTQLSELARRGSGSAARSIFGGYVEWLPGEHNDGSDSYATQVAPPEHWPLAVVIAITDERRKHVGSREGMAHAVKQSPFFPAWLASHGADLDAIRRGVLGRDLAAIGIAAEHNCLKMHAVAMAAEPPLIYWNPTTVAVMQRVYELRNEGLDCYFTIDAGPQVKVLCPVNQRDALAAAVTQTPGVHRVLLSQPGPGAEVLQAG